MDDMTLDDLDLLRQPELDASRLAEIAERQPSLRVAVAAHPALYDGLAEWLQLRGDAEVVAALRARESGNPVPLALAVASVDPRTAPETLATIAAEAPLLRERVAQHPRAYDDLIAWVSSVRPAAREAPTGAPGRLLPVAIIVAAALVSGSVTLANAVTFTTGIAAMAEVVASDDRLATAPSSDDGSSDSGVADGGGASDTNDVVAAIAEPQYQPTVLILDASGSMVRDAPSGGTRMEVARTAAIAVVDGLAEGAQMGLTVFGTGTGNSDAERAAGCTDVSRLIPVGDVDKDQFRAAISGITQSGFTPLGPSLIDAATQLAGSEEGLIVLVSDGVDTCSPPSSCDIAQDIKNANPGFTIHSIGFLVDADEIAREQLQCIASAGGGFYADASNPAQLAAQLRVLSDPVSTAGSVGAAGLGALKLGMSLDAALAADPSIELRDVILDVQFAICDSGELEFRSGRLYSIAPLADVPTAEGVAVGDNADRIRDVFRTVTPGEDDEGQYLSAPPSEGSDSAYRFYLGPDSRVIRIIICICGPGGGQQSEMSAWSAGFDGIGPITLGMTVDEAFDIIPDPGPDARWSTSSPGCPVVRLSTSGVGKAVSVWESRTSDSGEIVGYMIDGGAAAGAANLPLTDRGVGVGSTLAQLETAYPDITVVSYGDTSRLYAIVTARTGVSKVFYVIEGRVWNIQVSTTRMPIEEFCG